MIFNNSNANISKKLHSQDEKSQFEYDLGELMNE